MVKKTTHRILVINKFGEKNVYGAIGNMISISKNGWHKLILDYFPADFNAPIIIAVNSAKKSDEIIKDSWIVAGGELTHRIYGCRLDRYDIKDNIDTAKKDRIGSIFRSSSNESIYMVKINQWPRSFDIEIVAAETTFEERCAMSAGSKVDESRSIK